MSGYAAPALSTVRTGFIGVEIGIGSCVSLKYD